MVLDFVGSWMDWWWCGMEGVGEVGRVLVWERWVVWMSFGGVGGV